MKNDQGHLEPVAALYASSLQEHGPVPQAVGWRDQDAQALRFDRLADVIPPEERSTPLTVNDLGCGYAAMLDWLIDTGYQLSAYVGYDISAEMIEAADKAIRRPDIATLHVGSRMQSTADYSFASGIFNVSLEESKEDWQRYVERTIGHLAERSRRGFAFNALTTWVDYEEDHLYYADPTYYFDLCRRDHGRYVSLRHDYPLYEWTIHVRF